MQQQSDLVILQTNEERLYLALEIAQIGVWDWNLLTDRITWSEQSNQLFGLSSVDSSSDAFYACIYPGDRDSLQAAIHQARQECQAYTHQFRVIWADGSIHWIEGKGKFFYTPAGVPVRMLSIAREISDQKQVEERLQAEKDGLELRVAERTAEALQINDFLQQELEERKRTQAALEVSQARFAGILDIADDAIISIDRHQRISLFNQGAEKIFGYSAQEVLGHPLALLLPARFAAAHHDHVAEFGDSNSPARRMAERCEIYGRRQDGTEFPAEASISKLALGTEVVFTVFLRDVTDRKQIDRMKDEFISVVSHELRNPLTSIHASLGMLASGLLKADSAQGMRLLQIAVDSSDRLVRLINDILDIERIESGRVKMNKERCSVPDLITEAVNVMQSLADRSRVTLSVSSLLFEVVADPDRIIQTLTNLLSNAIKFSSAGSTVWLSAELVTERTARPAYILFTVKDQGRGIPADQLDSIFERFQQVDSSDARNHEGTGLGLSICRSIVQQHDGQIWVESSLGQGSTFFFSIPIQ
jgi:PAS domain S-box-containing protein